MSRPAVVALEDARDRVAALLWPVDRGRWLRLAVLVSLVGGVGSVVTTGANVEGMLPTPGGPDVPGRPGVDAVSLALPNVVELPDPRTGTTALVALGTTLLVLTLAYAVAGAVAEFVLVAGIRDGEVRLRRGVRRHLGRGVRLVAFRVGVLVLAVAAGLVPFALVVGATALDAGVGLLVVPAVAVAALVALAAWLVLVLTTDFVVPTMLHTDAAGPVDAWRRLAPVLVGAPLDAGLYLLVAVALGAVAAGAVGLTGALVALVVAVPFALVGAATLLLSGGSLGGVELAVLVAVALGYGVALFAALQVVRTPVVVYLRAYALATLGRLDPAVDLLGVADGTEDAESFRRERSP